MVPVPRKHEPALHRRRAGLNHSAKTYRLYGLVVRSALPLPFRQVNSTGSFDVDLQRAPAARFVRARTATASERWFSRQGLADGTTYLHWRGLCEFLVSADGRRIRFHPFGRALAESINVYLLGHVLSFALVARGVDPLHGTVVEIDGGAVALVGDCGSGKSTLAAALLGRGFPIVTDDLVALQRRGGDWRVHPGLPRIKLFPAAARRLGFDTAGVPMNGETSKQIIPLGARQVVERRIPLKAVYVLSRPGRSQAGSAPAIARVAGAEAFLEVIRGAFNLLVVDRNRLKNQFAFASRLVATVPVRRLIYSRKFSVLPQVCDVILKDLGVGSASDTTAG